MEGTLIPLFRLFCLVLFYIRCVMQGLIVEVLDKSRLFHYEEVEIY